MAADSTLSAESASILNVTIAALALLVAMLLVASSVYIVSASIAKFVSIVAFSTVVEEAAQVTAPSTAVLPVETSPQVTAATDPQMASDAVMVMIFVPATAACGVMYILILVACSVLSTLLAVMSEPTKSISLALSKIGYLMEVATVEP